MASYNYFAVSMALISSDNLGFHCGIDEAGRGPLAGPVVAAAVIFPTDISIEGLNDSKKLKSSERDCLFNRITTYCEYGVGFATVKEIDELNILKATFLAMRRSFLDLRLLPPYAIIDGNSRPDHFPCKTVLVVKGDSKVASIAAASIIAKVSRDRYMRCLAKKFPGYGWEKNFGYGVPFHKSALKSLGVTSEHRRSFAPIYNMLC